jgi:hypothetical protein
VTERITFQGTENTPDAIPVIEVLQHLEPKVVPRHFWMV